MASAPELNRAERFARLGANRNDVLRFSVEAEVAPGLTVGQMQHRDMIGRNVLNYLKRRWSWEELAPLLD